MTAGPLAPPTLAPAPERNRRKGWGWWVGAAIVLVPALVPPVALAAQVVLSGARSSIPTGRLIALFSGTALLTVAVTVTGLALGTATAWITTRTDLAARRLWSVLAALPLVVPSYLAALTIIGATGPGGMTAEVFGWSIPTPYGFTGAWLALSIFLAPMAHLIVSPALRAIDPATEEAATGLGAGRLRVFSTVTLPQLRPALVSAGLMMGLYTISDFGAVSLLRFDTFTRAIFTLYAGQIDRRPAATLSALLMVLAVVILFIERRVRSRATFGRAMTRRARPALRLGGLGRALSTTYLAGYTFLALVVPLAVLVFWLRRGIGAGNVPDLPWAELARSVGAAVAAALIAVLAAFPVAMVTTWRRRRLSPAVETSVWAIYSLPHITVGVAVVGFALSFARPAYQTLGLLLAVYVAMFLAQAVSPIQDSLSRASPDLEDASRGLGRGWLQTLARVTVPLTTPGILAAAALMFLAVMKELPATLLLRPTGFETLAIRIWSSTGEGFYTTASMAGLALLAVSIVPLLLLTNRDLSS